MLIPLIAFVFITIFAISRQLWVHGNVQVAGEAGSEDMLAKAKKAESRRNRKSCPVLRKFIKTSFLPTLSVVVITLYTYIIVSALGPLSCSETNGRFIMYRNPSQECFDSNWFSHLPFVIIFLALYGIIFPVGVGISFFRNRFKRHDPDFIRVFGSLVSPYRGQYFYWELISMFKRALFAVSAQFFITSYTIKSLASITIVGISGAIEAQFKPFASKRSNLMNCS
jgi:hypothetical protein